MVTGSLFLVYTVCFTLGIAAGFFMHRSDYCVAGMFRDAFLFRNTFMLRALFLQVVVTMVLFEAARLAGLLPLFPFPLLGFPSLSNIIGGFVFGIGMVLAGGCVVGTLYKMGAGSVVSGVAFVGLLLGSALYAELHPVWASFLKATSFFKNSKSVPQLTGMSPTLFVVVIGSVSVWFILKWRKEGQWERPSEVKGYIQPWKTAVSLACIGLLSYLAVGMPLGITTTYAKMAAMIENLFSPDHVSSVAFFQGLPLNIVHPVTDAVLRGGAGPQFDSVWAIQFPIIAGIILGSTLSAVLLREFTLRYRVPFSQFMMALGGGVLLGLASRMAPACNVWHLMGGLPILAIQSILFLIGLIPGTWVGSKIVSQLILKQSMTAAENS